jgi:hypothetical protein
MLTAGPAENNVAAAFETDPDMIPTDGDIVIVLPAITDLSDSMYASYFRNSWFNASHLLFQLERTSWNWG